jgi:hypothetical protein
VRDFHSGKQFQFRQTPETIEQAQVNYEEIAASWTPGTPIPADAPVKVDKLVQRVGLASSVTEASKKRAQRAVKIDDVVVLDPIYLLGTPTFPKSLTLQLGRKFRQVLVRGQIAP